jgi:hypothetical protein
VTLLPVVGKRALKHLASAQSMLFNSIRVKVNVHWLEAKLCIF